MCYLLIKTSNTPEDQMNVSKGYLLNFQLLAGSFGAISTVFGMFGPLSASFGCGARVLHLKQLLEGAELAAEADAVIRVPGTSLASLVTAAQDAVVQLSNICVRVPHSAQELVSGLSLTVPGNVLFMGPSGCGKLGWSLGVFGLGV